MSSSSLSHSDARLTSTTLLSRIRQRDAAAWRRLTELFGPLVFHWFRRQGLSEHDAADGVQEVFATVARAVGDFESTTKHGFRGWLWSIARTRLADIYREKAKQAAPIGGTAAWQRLAEITSGLADDPDEFTDREQLNSLHRRALELVRSEFETRTWQMFSRRVLDDQPTREVAEEFGISTHAVRQAKSRILRRLREELGE